VADIARCVGELGKEFSNLYFSFYTLPLLPPPLLPPLFLLPTPPSAIKKFSSVVQ